MNSIQIKNPRYADLNEQAIRLDVLFEDLGEFVEFMAMPNDCEAHGRDLYAHAQAGEFGVVQALPLETAKAIRLAEIDENCEEAMKTVVSSYPDSEKQTFPQQSAEAQAYLDDPTASVPLLLSLAMSRGMTLDEMARRVLNKHKIYSALSGKILGQRKTLQNRVKACSSLEEIEKIEATIKVPQQELNQYLS